jgi:hypothetical protein
MVISPVFRLSIHALMVISPVLLRVIILVKKNISAWIESLNTGEITISKWIESHNTGEITIIA